jgi:hypothetical protein
MKWKNMTWRDSARILFIVVCVLALFVVLQSVVSAKASRWDISKRPTQYWWTGDPVQDRAWKWAQDVDSMLELGANPGTGEVFYVDSGVTAEGDGTSWTQAKDTLDEAIALCTAARGDVILVAQGHQEVKAAAGDVFTLDIAGTTVIGVSNGGCSGAVASGAATNNLMPVFILDHADATATISAANCRISGLRFESDVADNANGVTLAATADGAVITGCLFSDGAAAEELVIGVSIAAGCDDVQISGCRFYTVPTGGCASGIKFVGASARSVIVGNWIQGDYSASCIDGVTAAGTLLTISDNYLINIDSTAGSCIDMHASTTGMTCNNRMMGGKSIADTWIAAGMVSIENYGTGAVSASGLVEPAVDGD